MPLGLAEMHDNNFMGKKHTVQTGRSNRFIGWPLGNCYLHFSGLTITGVYHEFITACNIGPLLDEKLFPVDRPIGFKRADWNFFSLFFLKTVFFSKIFCTF